MSGWRVTGHSDATWSVRNTTRVQPTGAGKGSTWATGPRVGWPSRVSSSLGASLIAGRLRLAPVRAARGAGLPHLDGAEPGQRGGAPIPDPHGDPLAGGVLETVAVVEPPVVERIAGRVQRRLAPGEVHHTKYADKR